MDEAPYAPTRLHYRNRYEFSGRVFADLAAHDADFAR
jgi:hypothetical protein